MSQTTGTAGNDSWTLISAGNASIDGLGGIDTLAVGNVALSQQYGYPGVVMQHSQFSFNLGYGPNHVDTISGASSTLSLTNMERLVFNTGTDKWAIDIDGNAGITAKVLGAVFGASAVSNPTYVGIGLNYLDTSISTTKYADLMQLAFNAAGATTSTAVVNLLWNNLFHAAPTAAEAAPIIAMIDSGSYTAGTLGVLAADTSFNATNINLVGLHQTGLHYA
jgi:hypothetical protein